MKRLKNESVYKQIYKLFSLIGGIYENQSLRFDFITLILLILSRCCEPFSIQAQEIATIIKCTIICCNIFYFFVINSGSLYDLLLIEYYAWLSLCVWWDIRMQCTILHYPYSFYCIQIWPKHRSFSIQQIKEILIYLATLINLV